MTVCLAVIVSAAVAAGVVGLGRVLGRRVGPGFAASGVGLAYVAGQVAAARPAIPPADVTDRIPWLALAATGIEAADLARGEERDHEPEEDR